MLLPPVEYAQSLLTQLWGSLGGTFSGNVRDAATPADNWLVTRAESRPLADLVRDINKHSNNVMARQVFLTLGRGADGAPATVESARDAITQWADARGLAVPELVLDNGAGLSRIERVSAGSLVRLLRAAAESPVGAEFIASLPLAGVDGTLKRWFVGTPVAGHAHLKTGYIEGVRAIAGYVHGDGGRTALVVGIINHRSARAAAGVQEALVTWALAAGTTPPAATPEANRGCGKRRPGGCTGMRRAAPMAPSPPSTTAR
jgi:D-alanyl-D-alanine carboxypeptidase/D-alanyl-D-alanine-endopeptidase (penicillin-binding protein 4)